MKIEKERMQDMLNDRNHELKQLKDPRALIELKGLLFQLDEQIGCITHVKED